MNELYDWIVQNMWVFGAKIRRLKKLIKNNQAFLNFSWDYQNKIYYTICFDDLRIINAENDTLKYCLEIFGWEQVIKTRSEKIKLIAEDGKISYLKIVNGNLYEWHNIKIVFRCTCSSESPLLKSMCFIVRNSVRSDFVWYKH